MNYQLYGHLFEDDPRLDERLRARVAHFDEDGLIEIVILPLLRRMGFEGLRKVRFHGREEFGRDVLPFRRSTVFGTFEYMAVQAKAVEIHGTASRPGNAGEIIAQAQQALNVSFVDDLDNERKRLDKIIVIASAAITPSARRNIEEAFEGNRQVVLIDLDRLLALLRQYQLHHYVLFSDRPESGQKLGPKKVTAKRVSPTAKTRH